MKHIFYRLFLCILIVGTSCAHDPIDVAIDAQKKANIEMSVVMLAPVVSEMKTRAQASPTEAVERIDVYSFDASGAFMRHTPFPSQNNPLRDVTTDDQKAQGIAEYKMVTQVIIPDDPDNVARQNFLFTNLTEEQVATLRDKVNDKRLTIDDVRLLTQEIEQATNLPTNSNFNFQMWGMVYYDDFFKEPKLIYMYRNVSKISLALSSDLSSDYEIGTVKIAGKRNLKSYLMPAEHSSLNNNNQPLEDKHIHIPSQDPKDANVPMTPIDGRYVGYTFEYNNKEAAADSKQYLLMSVVRKSDNKTLWYRVDLYSKAKKEYYNLIRNHHYKITITDIQLGSGYDSEEEVKTKALMGNNILNAEILNIDELMTNVVSNGQFFLAVSKNVETYGGQNGQISLGFVETNADEKPTIQSKNVWIDNVTLTDLGDGKKYEIKATINHANMPGDREGTITFEVRGLERTLTINDKQNSFEFEHETNFLSYRKDFPTYIRAKLKYPVSPAISTIGLTINSGDKITLAMEAQEGDTHNQWIVLKATPKNDRYDPVSNFDLGQATIRYPGFADAKPHFRQAHFIDGIGETAQNQYKHGILAIYRDDADNVTYTVSIQGIYGDWSMESNMDWIEIANAGGTPAGKAFITGKSNVAYQSSNGASLSANGSMKFSYRLKPNTTGADRFGRILFHYNNNQATHIIYVHQGLRDVVMPNFNSGSDLSPSVTWAAMNSIGGIDGQAGSVGKASNPSNIGDRYVTGQRNSASIISMPWTDNSYKINYQVGSKDIERWYYADNEHDPCPTGYMVPRLKQLATLSTPQVPDPYQATHFTNKNYRTVWGVINKNFSNSIYQSRGGLLYIDETDPEQPKTFYLPGGGILRDYDKPLTGGYERLLGFWHFQNSDAVNNQWGIDKGYPYANPDDFGSGIGNKNFKYGKFIYRPYATEGTHYWGVTNELNTNYEEQPFLSVFRLPNARMGAAQWYFKDCTDYLYKAIYQGLARDPSPQFAVRCVKKNP